MTIRFKYLLIISIILFGLNACSKDNPDSQKRIEITDGDVDGSLKINEIQYLGSHNSYRINTDKDVFDALSVFQSAIPENLSELDYTHLPLVDQFTLHGIRQIELDIFTDKQGGLFYNRQGQSLIQGDVASGIPALQNPGIKLLHLPDIDYNTHHYTFVDALEEIEMWSDEYPEHLPIFILLETKSDDLTQNAILATLGYTVVEQWDQEGLVGLDAEIRSVFTDEDLLRPEDIQGSYGSINEAILDGSWPTIDETRGKVVLFFNNESESLLYDNIHTNVSSRLVFNNAAPGTPNAAFLLRNNPNDLSISALVDQGYMIRTRSDAGTYQARDNDYSDWNTSLLSGAHFISTDYYVPDYRSDTSSIWSDYSVGFDNGLYRNNPITNP